MALPEALSALKAMVLNRDKPPSKSPHRPWKCSPARRPARPGCWNERGRSCPRHSSPKSAGCCATAPTRTSGTRPCSCSPPPASSTRRSCPPRRPGETRPGHADCGRQLVLNSEAQCLRCHAFHGVGGNIGPDSVMIGKKASKENLFESILLPSRPSPTSTSSEGRTRRTARPSPACSSQRTSRA